MSVRLDGPGPRGRGRTAVATADADDHLEPFVELHGRVRREERQELLECRRIMSGTVEGGPPM